MDNPNAEYRVVYQRLVWVALALVPQHSQATTVAFSEPHAVLAQAIRTGSASGVMTGSVAEHFTRQFRSIGQLLVNAKVIQNLANPDCKRLEMVFTKQDVETPKGRTEAILKTQLDYCLDGGPPIAQKVAP